MIEITSVCKVLNNFFYRVILEKGEKYKRYV